MLKKIQDACSGGKPILFWNFSNFLTFILGSANFLLPRRKRNAPKSRKRERFSYIFLGRSTNRRVGASRVVSRNKTATGTDLILRLNPHKTLIHHVHSSVNSIWAAAAAPSDLSSFFAPFRSPPLPFLSISDFLPSRPPRPLLAEPTTK